MYGTSAIKWYTYEYAPVLFSSFQVFIPRSNPQKRRHLVLLHCNVGEWAACNHRKCIGLALFAFVCCKLSNYRQIITFAHKLSASKQSHHLLIVVGLRSSGACPLSKTFSLWQRQAAKREQRCRHVASLGCWLHSLTTGVPLKVNQLKPLPLSDSTEATSGKIDQILIHNEKKQIILILKPISNGVNSVWTSCRLFSCVE